LFRKSAVIGGILGTALALGLSWRLGLSLWITAGCALAAVAAALGEALLEKVVTGEERLVNYHQQIAAFGICAAGLALSGAPVPAYLDVVAMGVALFLACGRVGCLTAGCCHGRPARWGIRYGAVHAAEGFPAALVGVRLFPVQALESFWCLGIAVSGSIWLWSGAPPGSVWSWHAMAYGLGRFGFEFLRGDAERPYRWGFSEAQWTALLTVAGVIGLEMMGWLPRQLWQWGGLLGLVVVMAGVSLYTRRNPEYERLRQPRHLYELAEALRALQSEAAVTGTVMVATTSLGVQISAGIEGARMHYTVSRRGAALTQKTADLLAALIVGLRHAGAFYRVLPGQTAGVYHLLIEV